MNPKLMKLIDETMELARQIRNLKSKIKGREKKLTKMFEALERNRIEAEIELLKVKVTALRIEEMKYTISIIATVAKLDERKQGIDDVDWSKAGKA